jgi:hypothetical protein
MQLEALLSTAWLDCLIILYADVVLATLALRWVGDFFFFAESSALRL